jgi:hypothetical protein
VEEGEGRKILADDVGEAVREREDGVEEMESTAREALSTGLETDREDDDDDEEEEEEERSGLLGINLERVWLLGSDREKVGFLGMGGEL